MFESPPAGDGGIPTATSFPVVPGGGLFRSASVPASGPVYGFAGGSNLGRYAIIMPSAGRNTPVNIRLRATQKRNTVATYCVG